MYRIVLPTTAAAANTTAVALVPSLAVVQAFPETPLKVNAEAGQSTDSLPITSFSFDYGDGTPPDVNDFSVSTHTYAAPGTYTVTVTEQDSGGTTASLSRPIVIGSPYVPVAPQRLLDTRVGTGAAKAKIGADAHVGLQVAGVDGIPTTGITAVVLNVTATNPTASSFLTVYPDGTTRPTASNLNYTAGQTIPNLVTVPVGADGKVDFYNHVGSVDVIADIEGFYRMADTPEGPSGAFQAGYLVGEAPERLLDTRDGTGAPAAPLRGGVPLSVNTLTVPNIPQNVELRGVVLNVTVTNPSTSSNLTVYPDNTALPVASNLNFTAGETVSNSVIVPIALGDGLINIVNHSGTADVIADVEGFYTEGPGGAFVPVAPTRLLDTRTGSPIGPNTVRSLAVAGAAGIPASASAAALNVTATDANTSSFLTVYPDGAARPNASNINFSAGQTIPNMVTASIGSDGKVDFYNHVGSVDAIADVFGYFTGFAGF
ncbi:MAG TPA: PKD domain-containing protein [Pseudonocardiaceae bacterium]|nr:PKD domain-containing protein [Pseudonocardiaceae bacterium]